jgi:hypothetical protein
VRPHRETFAPRRAAGTRTVASCGLDVPNQPRKDNPHRSVRVEDDLWEAARIAAAEEDTTRGDIMRQALRELVERNA